MVDGNVTDRCARGFAMPSAFFRLVNLVLLIIAVGYLTFVSSEREADRQLLILVHRDGEHNPDLTFPTDRHPDWPGGAGALTEKGATQLCNLGLKIHARYRHLFPTPDSYSNNICSISSSKKRCRDGIQYLLRCLPADILSSHDKSVFIKQVLTNKINSGIFGNQAFVEKSVATDIIPEELDNILLLSMACPKYDQLLRDLRNNPKDKLDYGDIYKQVAVGAGEPQDTMDVVRVAEIFETVRQQEHFGKDMPFWAANNEAKLLEIKKRANLLCTETSYMKRIRGGYLLAEIYSDMRNRCAKNDITVKFYSGHESTLVNLMNTLGIIDATSSLPHYGAALAIELFQVGASCDSWEIEMIYYRDTNTMSYPTTVPHIPICPSPCTVKKIGAAVETILTSGDGRDYASGCKL